jgi:hypothetical protein
VLKPVACQQQTWAITLFSGHVVVMKLLKDWAYHARGIVTVRIALEGRDELIRLGEVLCEFSESEVMDPPPSTTYKRKSQPLIIDYETIVVLFEANPRARSDLIILLAIHNDGHVP